MQISVILIQKKHGIYLLHDPKLHESPETKHFYVCPKCSQVTSTEDPIIKKKGSLDIVTNDEAPIISIVDDESPEVMISKRMKYGQREERSTDSLICLVFNPIT